MAVYILSSCGTSFTAKVWERSVGIAKIKNWMLRNSNANITRVFHLENIKLPEEEVEKEIIVAAHDKKGGEQLARSNFDHGRGAVERVGLEFVTMVTEPDEPTPLPRRN